MTQINASGSLIGKIGSYLQIITKDPHSTAFVPLAEAYRQIGLLDDALEAAKLGTRMLPQFSPGFATLGRVLGQMGRIDESMGAYAKALSLEPQSQSALIGLARLHLIRGERDQARTILQQAAEFHPTDETIKNTLAALDLPRPWSDIRQVPEVHRTEAEIVEKGRPEKPIPTVTLAEIYAKQGLVDKASEVYLEILTLDPRNNAARQRLAELKPDLLEYIDKNDGSRTTDRIVGDHELLTAVEAPAVLSEEQTKDQSILAVLERWLVIIKRRKLHV